MSQPFYFFLSCCWPCIAWLLSIYLINLFSFSYSTNVVVAVTDCCAIATASMAAPTVPNAITASRLLIENILSHLHHCQTNCTSVLAQYAAAILLLKLL